MNFSRFNSIQEQQCLGCLGLNKKFIKTLNHQDIDFAAKQYHTFYAQQMGRLSYQFDKIKKVKLRLKSLQNQEQAKVLAQQKSLQNKINSINKNRQKLKSQKIKELKLNQQFWQTKMKNIKIRIKTDSKARSQKASQYGKQIQQFWNSKTHSFSNDPNKITPNQNHKHKNKQQMIQNSTDSKLVIQQSTKQQKIEIRNSISYRKNQRVITELQDISSYARTNRNHTQISCTSIQASHQRNSIFSKRQLNHQDNTNKYKVNLKNVNRNKISQSKIKNFAYQTVIKQNNMHKQCDMDQKLNVTFQKTMKKLDKITKLRQKNLKNSLISIHPSKSRKPINDLQYRSLRVKSETKKVKPLLQRNNINQDKDNSSQQNTIDNNIVKIKRINKKFNQVNTDLQKISNYSKNIQKKVNSIKNNLNKNMGKMKNNHQSSNQIQFENKNKREETDNIAKNLYQQQKKSKKGKLVKAIKERVNKIKMEHLRKFTQNDLLSISLNS